MTALREDAINLIQTIPEKYLTGLYEHIQDFVFDKMDKEADKNYELWNANPDKYENEINEYCCLFVKKIRREMRKKQNANID